MRAAPMARKTEVMQETTAPIFVCLEVITVRREFGSCSSMEMEMLVELGRVVGRSEDGGPEGALSRAGGAAHGAFPYVSALAEFQHVRWLRTRLFLLVDC